MANNAHIPQKYIDREYHPRAVILSACLSLACMPLSSTVLAWLIPLIMQAERRYDIWRSEISGIRKFKPRSNPALNVAPILVKFCTCVQVLRNWVGGGAGQSLQQVRNLWGHALPLKAVTTSPMFSPPTTHEARDFFDQLKGALLDYWWTDDVVF